MATTWFPTCSEQDYICQGQRVPQRGDLVSHASTYEGLGTHPGDRLFVVTSDLVSTYQQRKWRT